MWNKIKNAWKSKTMIFGMLLQAAPLVQEYFGAIGDPRGYMIIGLIMMWLRYVTTKPLDEK